MSLYQFQVVMSGPTGLPTDKYVNTWHFNNPGAGPDTDFDNVRDMLKDFYTKNYPTNSVQQFMTTLIEDVVAVKAYRLDDPKPRTPAYESTFSFTNLGTQGALPFEVALCASFQATKVSGQPQARRRNRVYLGPLTTLGSDVYGYPTDAFCLVVINALQALKAASTAAVNWDWVGWSETGQQQWTPTNVWCDNSWDTQRRRGRAATERQQYNV